MCDWVKDVLVFHKTVNSGQVLTTGPGLPSDKIKKLKWDLISEEIDELKIGIENDNISEIADACIDSIYVLIGIMLSYGIEINAIWDLVHSSNLKKVGGGKLPNGKIDKPNDWKPPDIEREISRQVERK